MLKEINPKIFNLSSRVKLYGHNSELIQIIKKRKSRIIMKDGLQILEIANSIRKLYPNVKIEVLVSGPVCSKTISFLESHNISIIKD